MVARVRPELTPDWRDPGNGAEVDEYLRRQTMSERDYPTSWCSCAATIPDESFLLVRSAITSRGSARMIDPTAAEDDDLAADPANDPRYFTTYYAIDPVNFGPVDLSSALGTLEAPICLSSSRRRRECPWTLHLRNRKTNLKRCHGMFFVVPMAPKRAVSTGC